MSKKEMIEVLGVDGTVIELDWKVLRYAIETLQKLAPPDTRSDPIFLDKLYENKLRLRKMYEAQVEKKEKDFLKMVNPQETMDGKKNNK